MKELRAGSHREVIPRKMLQFLESILPEIAGGGCETGEPHSEANTFCGGDCGRSVQLSDDDSPREDREHRYEQETVGQVCRQYQQI